MKRFTENTLTLIPGFVLLVRLAPAARSNPAEIMIILYIS